MQAYTVFLFRSGRVYVREGTHEAPNGIEAPLLTAHVSAKTEIAALGKVLLEQVDRANQPNQHVCLPCDKPHVEDSFIACNPADTSHLDSCAACQERVLGL